MKKIGIGVILTLIILVSIKYCSYQKETNVLSESSSLIKDYIKHVGKLVVTEGHFSEVFNYKNSKEILGSYITADKKALVVVNASITVSYDLSLLKYTLDEENQTITIVSIPEEEITINPDLEYYDVQADFLNPFEAKDYNTIKERINTSLLHKLEQSSLKTNAKDRLLSELSKFYILTNSLGWTLVYNENEITNMNSLEL